MGIMVHNKIKQYIKEWEKRCYNKGIPDEAPIGLVDKVPSYQKIAIALLKNDFNLKSLGYKTKESKYYSILKRIEIDARKTNKQLKLF